LKNAKETSGGKPSKNILQRSTTTFIEREGLDKLRLTNYRCAETVNRMTNRLIAAAAWACFAFIVFATLSPIEARPVIAGGLFTAVERFGAYAVFGFLLYLAYPRHLTFVCIVVLGSAVTLELLQSLLPDRHPRTLDAIEKLLGGVAGITSAIIFQSSIWPKLMTVVGRTRRD
jgi:VanZ family protein